MNHTINVLLVSRIILDFASNIKKRLHFREEKAHVSWFANGGKTRYKDI